MVKKFGIGQSAPRVEDARFLTGHGRYTDDLETDGAAIGVVLRSPFAHADVKSIDTAAASGMGGVLAVYTASDLAGQVGDLPCEAPLPSRDGSPVAAPPWQVLAQGRVRYVGQPVAFVVADTLAQAKAAAEAIDVDYDPLEAVAGIEAAMAGGAAEIWPEAAGNVSLDWEVGDEAATDAAFADAAHVTKIHLINNRVVPSPIETRAAIGSWDDETGLTLTTSSQGVHSMQSTLVKMFEGIEKDRLRVVTTDVGGGFGMKAFVFNEHALVLYAARALSRTVKWTGDRSEAFLNDTHGRDLISDVSLAFDADGHILGYRTDTLSNFGAYLSQFAPFIQTMAPVRITGGVYKIPAIYTHVRCLLTNTAPVDAYRGAGRPEANYMLERAMNKAASELGLGEDELRRRNMIPASDLPYTTALGSTFDSGDFPATMEKAMDLAGWAGFEARRSEAEARGALRGIGMAYYIECTLGPPAEDVSLNFTGDGRVELIVGTQSNGQGHETAFAQIVAEKLGIDAALVTLVEGDTDRKEKGAGTGGSHSLELVGNASLAACDDAIQRGLKLAAMVLDADDISFEDGLFLAKGTNRSIPLMELTAELSARDDLPDGLDDGLSCTATYKSGGSTFPNGCHIAEVEIDPETGTVDLVAYSVVDDFGTVINPKIVAGQVHGGVVQGVGQALTENCVYEEGSGQLITGSFMDYGMPRADDMPHIAFEMNPTPCTTNPLGIKGCGEAGTIGACPSVMNAVAGAVGARGTPHIDMPATPQAVWAALNG